MSVVNKITGRGLPDMINITTMLGEGKARTVYRRAINHTGNKGFTKVKRSLARQVGLPQAQIIKRGSLQKFTAGTVLEYVISSRGSAIPLKDFKARQFRYGVTASPWGTRRKFKSAFIVASIGGNVFKRSGAARLPIAKMWGPSIPRELVKDETADAFRDVSRDLPKRVNHELIRMTGGKLS